MGQVRGWQQEMSVPHVLWFGALIPDSKPFATHQAQLRDTIIF